MQDVVRKNNVVIKGKGERTMLFAHGFGCDQNAWKYLTPCFEESYKIVLFDYVGAGRSDLSSYDPKQYDSLEGYVSDVLEICNALELKDVIFIGHSVSCMIGALAAIKQPALFKKLIFIGPSPCYINNGDYIGGLDKEAIDSLLEVMEEDYITWARALAPQIMNEQNGSGLSGELADSFCAIDPVIGKQFARVTFLGDNRRDLKYIPVESLTIQSSDDTIAPLSVGEYIQKHTPGNKLTVIEGHGHCLHMSDPVRTAAAITEYLKD